MRYLDRLRRTPTEEAPLLPVLRTHDWPLFIECVSRSLLTYTPGKGVPRVAIGRPKGDGFDMMRRAALDELGMSFEELEAFAIGNLARVPTEWQVIHRNEGTDRPMMLGLPDEGSITASRVLDEALLRKAHDLIDSPLLFVGMPSEHELYAVDGSAMADRQLHRAFLVWLTRHWQAAEGVDALSDLAFVIREGSVLGRYVPPVEG